MPVIILRLFWKSINFAPYRYRIFERLGLYKDLSVAPGGFLVHAVSVGEVVLTGPVIKALQHAYPRAAITLTTTTPTGSARVIQNYGAAVQHVYLPYDLPWAVNSFLNKVQPKCVIIMETEIWPHLINACWRRSIPIIIANGRLSDNSIKRYVWVKFFLKKVLPQLTFVTAQSKTDGARFLQLGLPTEKLLVTGNLKFDAQVNTLQADAGRELKETCAKRLIWVAASTHAGEESQILQAFREVQKAVPDLLLVLIPRHPDRFNEVADLLKEQRFNFTRRSNQELLPQTEVLLGDSMGEMWFYYAFADIAFIGGSLVPIGGHNLLEPAALGIPTVTGQHYHNFKDITHLLQSNDAVQIVQNANDLAQVILALCNAVELRAQYGRNALQVVEQNKGAIADLTQVVVANFQDY